MWSHDLGLRELVRRIQITGHSASGNPQQCWIIFRFYLSVCWHSVAGFACTFWQSRSYISYFGCCHMCCRGTLFSEYRMGSWIILYCITTQHDAPLYFRNCLSYSEFLMCWKQKRCKMNGFLWFLDYFFCASHFGFLPCCFFLKENVPFLAHATFSSEMFIAFGKSIGKWAKL